ncbi:serine hydrolase [Pontibacter oryzae]|uniref:Beta-lactamase class A catalytic domain-containing protein n=1 Tax=Pontibacter oryzae TaxID=2304593 RepID=A0A399RWZ9_9BACT|nr:serine hydrolase [Pontibacter oryzae]RIJ34312.1 hypothetical protein D1627_15430 [Pontibacter oryzae]
MKRGNASWRFCLSILLSFVLALAYSFIPLSAMAQQPTNSKLLRKIMRKHPEQFKHILAAPEKYRVQVLYTQIDRDAQNRPAFASHTFHVNPEEYFYPASTVKLPAAALALEKLNALGLDKYTSVKIDSAWSGQSAVSTDHTSESGLPSLAHYIKKVLLVSDNDAYNRLYEFLGQQQLNEGLQGKGFREARLTHRLSIFLSPEENSRTNPFTFYQGNNILYRQPEAVYTSLPPNALQNTLLGKGYYQSDQLVEQPMDFSAKNYISVEVLQGVLKSILFPEAVETKQRFNLSPQDYTFLYKYMSMLPRESRYPKYDPKEYPDSYAKFLMFGNETAAIPEHIRIFNKIGDAYGFMIDNAYIVDFKNKVEFMLTAVIYVNEDEVLNDGKYEYETIGFPFMKNLGQAVYQYELGRKRKHQPDLSRFKIDYSSTF